MLMKTTKDKSKNKGSTITYQIFQDIRYDRSHKNLSKQKNIRFRIWDAEIDFVKGDIKPQTR